MPVSGLVITLSDEINARRHALAAIESDERLTVGERQKNCLPVVADTESIQEGSRLVRQELMDLDGVEFVDVVSVNFEDEVLDDADADSDRS